MIPIGNTIGFALCPIRSMYQPGRSHLKLTMAKDPFTVFVVFIKPLVTEKSDVNHYKFFQFHNETVLFVSDDFLLSNTVVNVFLRNTSIINKYLHDRHFDEH